MLILLCNKYYSTSTCAQDNEESLESKLNSTMVLYATPPRAMTPLTLKTEEVVLVATCKTAMGNSTIYLVTATQRLLLISQLPPAVGDELQ